MSLFNQLLRLPAANQLAPALSARLFATGPIGSAKGIDEALFGGDKKHADRMSEVQQAEAAGQTAATKGSSPKAVIPEVPGWKEEHASESEATIKADRHDGVHTSVEELQQHTVHVVQEKHHGAGSKH